MPSVFVSNRPPRSNENQDGTRGSNLIAPAKSQSLATAHPARSKRRDFVRLSGLYMTPGLSVAERVWQATARELLAADSGPLDDLVLAYPTTTRKSQGSEGLHSARLAHCCACRRRSPHPTDSRRSGLAAGTGLHAPFWPFTGTTKVGAKAGKLSFVPPSLVGQRSATSFAVDEHLIAKRLVATHRAPRAALSPVSTPPHSITSSARASIDGGMVRPSVLAVWRLTTSSKVVGCWTGRSAGLTPLRIFPP